MVKFKKNPQGFTLIELLVVMAIIATLLTITLPRYTHNLDKSKEYVLRHNLSIVRESIDKYYADKGRYPANLQALVNDQYLHELPYDPITERADSWQLVSPKNSGETGLANIKSGAQGNGSNGIAYSEW